MKKSITCDGFRLLVLSTLMNICLMGILNAQPYSYSSGEEFWKDVSPHEGPCTVLLGDNATLKIPQGYLYLEGNDVKKFEKFTKNLHDPSRLGILLPNDGSWFVFFSYTDSGYIKEEKVDKDAIFKAMKNHEPDANKERESLGYSKLYLTGWFFEPHYNPLSNNLEWAFLIESSQNGKVVNFNTRILGRTGYMEACLVMSPEQKHIIRDFQSVMDGFSFKSGYKYAEWKAGDKVAEYGLTALITGGAVAVAAKSGFLAKFWKLILVGIIAIFGWVKYLFTGNKQ